MFRRYTPYFDFLDLAQGYCSDAALQHSPEYLLHQFTLSGKSLPPENTCQPILFMLDFSQKKYLSITPSIKGILGYSSRYVADGGVDFIVSRYHPNDGKIYFNDIFIKNVEFLRRQPVDSHPEFCLSYNYRFKNKSGEYRTILQKFVIIRSAPDGTPLIMLATLTDITHYKQDGKIIHTIERMNLHSDPELLYKHIYPESTDVALSKRETEVLKWISEGLSSKQVASKLNISINTVHNHRKNMLDKTNCGNMPELLKFAIEQGLL